MSGRAWFLAAMMVAAVPCVAQTSATPTDSVAGKSRTMTPAPPAAPLLETRPEFPRGKISGQVIADYYYNLAGDPVHRYGSGGADSALAGIDGATNASGGPKNIGKDLNGVLIRRVYFQADHDLSIRFSTRFRLEADSRSLTSDGKIGVSVKAAYLQARNAIPRGDLYMGLFDTPTWDLSEEFWEYRSIEKTLPDFRGLGSRADLGAQLKGFFDSEHRFGYAGMIGNGVGQRAETNRYKKFYACLPVHLGDFRFEPYADYESAFGPQDKATYKIFAGYEFRPLALGVEAVDRVNHQPAGGNQEPQGVTVFVRGAASPTLAGFARFDFWRPDRRDANRVDAQLWIAGVDWQPLKDVHFMPNLEATQYDAHGTGVAPPHHDVQVRVTIFYKFVKP